MSYVALYRRYRPKTFNDVVGQDHIVRTLKNQLRSNKVAHAYLFSGGRGSGKTSTAKILARAINCLNPKDGEPCNECEICRQALAGTLTDISEIDAASNNGVDNIRDIREEVEFLPTSAKYRVYIIDEVHMLSSGAFNALLKTLEEPPKHVIFILATTEPQKLPVTILSRCQRFEFKRMSIENIINRLKNICEEIKIEIDDAALKIIAKMSDGAMRDAISLLERCIADGETRITEEKIRELVGIPEIEYLLNLSMDLVTGNSENVLKDTENIIKAGKNLEVFIWEEIKFLRDIMMLKIDDSLITYKAEDLEKMRKISDLCEKAKIIKLIVKLSELQNSMKWAMDREIIFETGILKILYDEINTSSYKINQEETKPKVTSGDAGTTKGKILLALKENNKQVIIAILSKTEIDIVDDELVHINFTNVADEYSRQYMQRAESKTALKEAVSKALEKEMKIKYIF